MVRRIFFPALLIFLIMTGVVFAAGVIALPQTGQTKCYDTAGMEINCAGTGQDGEIRAGVPWPSPRNQITYCNASGPCANQSVDCDGSTANDIVTDNLTGLIWPRYQLIISGIGSLTWDGAINAANTLTLCGYTDWVIPNVNELESLVNSDALLAGTGGGLWSSTRNSVKATQHEWAVNINTGQVGRYTRVGSQWPALPVRLTRVAAPAEVWKTGQIFSLLPGDDGDVKSGVAWPVPRFIYNGNGIVTDELTGLVWLKDGNCMKTKYPGYDNDAAVADGKVTWQHALNFIKDINNGLYPLCDGGYRDWRLPNRKELLSLINYSGSFPAIQSGHPFINAGFNAYWTSTTSGARNMAFVLDMMEGYLYTYEESTFVQTTKDKSFAVWPVRTGPAVTLVDYDYYCDNDTDGYFGKTISGTCGGDGCEPSGCQLAPGNDCNDGNAGINPGASDSNCNGVDENCSGWADEDYPAVYTNCGTGMCWASGWVICSQGAVVQQQCVPKTPQIEGPIGDVTCDDLQDNDCDGMYDMADIDCGDIDIDGIPNDGDSSGIIGDNPCIGGNTSFCDDNCLNAWNEDQADSDFDGVGDACDNCPAHFSADQSDTDNDGIGNVCDNCRLVSNPDQRDDNASEDDNKNKDGIQHYGDACDPDFDNDGLVTLSDYAEWRKYYRQSVPPAPESVDLDNDNLVGLSDYAVWRKYYRGVPGP